MLTIRHVQPDGARRVALDELEDTMRAPGFVWVDLSAPSSEHATVLDSLDLPRLVIEDMRDDQHLPKLELIDGTCSLTVHGLDLATLEGRLDTIELDCALREDLLVTFADDEPASVRAVGARLDDGRLGFDRPFLLLHRLLDAMNDVLVPFVDHLDRRLDVIEEDVLDQPTQHTRHDLYRLQRDVIHLRRIVLPQAEVVRRLGRDRAPGWQSGDEALVRDLYDHLNRMVAMCDSYHQLLDSAMANYRSALDDRLNDMLATLTIVSAVLLPVSVVAGLWGMNFVEIPGAQNPDGFWITLVASGAVIALMLVWFSLRGWIGRRAERRGAQRRRRLSGALEVPLLGSVLKVPVTGGRVVGRAARRVARGD